MPREKDKRPELKAVPPPPALEMPEPATSVFYACEKCFDTGIEVIPGSGARKCECRIREAAKNGFRNVRLPRRYDGFHFHNYKPQTVSQQTAFKLATAFAMEYPAVDRGLLFMGSVGVGKTHLAVSILKGLTERGFKCLFYDLGSLLKEIQDSYNPDTHSSEMSVLSPVLNVDVLVLDELGATKPTDWVRDTLSNIITGRYNDRKTTIITTNYLDQRRSERDETLEDRIGTRLRSRLYEMCRTVAMDGRDYRRTFDQPNTPAQ
jgi:DNA replication protein DnaC